MNETIYILIFQYKDKIDNSCKIADYFSINAFKRKINCLSFRIFRVRVNPTRT